MIKSCVRIHTLLNSCTKLNAAKKLNDTLKRSIHSSASVGSTVNWDMVGSICVERRPLITRNLSDIELRFRKYMEEVNLEKSHLSDHELRHLEDLRRAEELKKLDDADIQESPVQTAQDYEDACEAELKAFTPAPRITEADVKKDQRSLNRALDRSLVLVVRQKLGTQDHWLLPQAVYSAAHDSALRATAERALARLCGPSLRANILGNAPFGFYKYKYPKAMRAESSAIGARVFFFKAYYQEGQVDESIGVEHRWLTRTELKEFLHPDYLKAVRQILIPQDPEDLQANCSL